MIEILIMLYIADARGCTSGEDNDNAGSQTGRQTISLRHHFTEEVFKEMRRGLKWRFPIERSHLWPGRYVRLRGVAVQLLPDSLPVSEF
jgi:hypothetical protein